MRRGPELANSTACFLQARDDMTRWSRRPPLCGFADVPDHLKRKTHMLNIPCEASSISRHVFQVTSRFGLMLRSLTATDTDCASNVGLGLKRRYRIPNETCTEGPGLSAG